MVDLKWMHAENGQDDNAMEETKNSHTAERTKNTHITSPAQTKLTQLICNCL